MRMLLLGAAFVLAGAVIDVPEAEAQSVGLPGASASGGARGGWHRGGRSHRANDAISRMDRRMALARLRGNDPSRDIHSGFRWGSPGEVLPRGFRGGRFRAFDGYDDFDLCRIRSGGGEASDLMYCGRARGYADDIPGISLIPPSGLGQSPQTAATPAPPATTTTAPVVRTLSSQRIVRGPSAAPAPTYAIRTVGGR